MKKKRMSLQRQRIFFLYPLPANEPHTGALEVIVLDKVVQVDTETFKGNAQMMSEVEMIRHPYIVMLVLRILRQ
jgi:hypothetical protein